MPSQRTISQAPATTTQRIRHPRKYSAYKLPELPLKLLHSVLNHNRITRLKHLTTLIISRSRIQSMQLSSIGLLREDRRRRLRVRSARRLRTRPNKFIQSTTRHFVSSRRPRHLQINLSNRRARLMNGTHNRSHMNRLLLLPAQFSSKIKMILLLKIIKHGPLTNHRNRPITRINSLNNPATILLNTTFSPLRPTRSLLSLRRLHLKMLIITQTNSNILNTNR